MDLPINHFKRSILAGKQQIGLWCGIQDGLMAEMVANTGFDWLLFDAEHTPLDVQGIACLLQAVAPYPVSTLVRPTHLNVAEIKKLLDIGAQTIVVPYVQSVEDAKLAAAAVAYPPKGIRGVAGTIRASRFAAVQDYHQRAREEICLIVQIETASAMEALDDIASVDGVDGVFIGPADLAASMGYGSDITHPDVREACVNAVKRLRELGKPAGFLSLDEGFVHEMIDAGCVFTAVSTDAALLRNAATSLAKHWKGCFSPRTAPIEVETSTDGHRQTHRQPRQFQREIGRQTLFRD